MPFASRPSAPWIPCLRRRGFDRRWPCAPPPKKNSFWLPCLLDSGAEFTKLNDHALKFLPARLCASAVLAISVLSLPQIGVLSKRLNSLSWYLAQMPPSTISTPFSARQSSQRLVNLIWWRWTLSLRDKLNRHRSTYVIPATGDGKFITLIVHLCLQYNFMRGCICYSWYLYLGGPERDSCVYSAY